MNVMTGVVGGVIIVLFGVMGAVCVREFFLKPVAAPVAAPAAPNICRCVDLQAKATTQDTWLSMHEARLEDLEKRGIPAPAASTRLDDLDREVRRLERRVAEGK
jgi:hypothetical protein